jgi:hypothetical protein
MVAGSDTALIVGVFVFVSGVTVNGVLLVDKGMVGGVVVSSSKGVGVVVSSGVGICSPTLDTPGSSINIPDRPGVLGNRAESAKCLVCWEGGFEVIFALDRWPKFAGNWPSFPPPGQ